jgi:hypothetical protein
MRSPSPSVFARKPGVLALAADPATNPGHLSELARKDRARRTRALVAQNPSTPPEVLIGLLEDFPAQVLGNPAWVLLEMERPGLYADLSSASVLALLKLPAPPPAVFEVSVEWKRGGGRVWDAWTAAVEHPQCPPGVLRRFATFAAEHFRAKAAEHPSTPLDVLETLATERYWRVPAALAFNPSAPLSLIEGLRQHHDEIVRNAATRALQARGQLVLEAPTTPRSTP